MTPATDEQVETVARMFAGCSCRVWDTWDAQARQPYVRRAEEFARALGVFRAAGLPLLPWMAAPPAPSRSPSPVGAPQAEPASPSRPELRFALWSAELEEIRGRSWVLRLACEGAQASVWLDLDKRRELAVLLALPGEVAAGLARERAELEALRAELVTLREEVTKLEARPITSADVVRWLVRG